MTTSARSDSHVLTSTSKRKRKLTPPQSTLRDCVIENLSLSAMVTIAGNGSADFDTAFRKVSQFALWRAYQTDVQAMDAPAVRLHCWEASRASGRRERDAHRYLACRFAVLHLVRDPAVRAAREAIEISSSVQPLAARAAGKRL